MPHVSAWPGLSPAHFLGPQRAVPFPLSANNKAFFYLARNAIYYLTRQLLKRRPGFVLMPDYHSGNEVWAVRAAGAPVRFYRIGPNMQPDLDEIERELDRGPAAFYVIHFLGWPQPIAEIAELCRARGIPLIEDCALSLLAELDGRPLGSFGDYAVYCLYKTVPVPNGGLLVDNTDQFDWDDLSLTRAGALSVAGRTCELTLEWTRTWSEMIGGPVMKLKREVGRALNSVRMNRTAVGDIGFDLGDVSLGMSGLCGHLLERFDYDEVQRKRREHFEELGRLLGDVVTPVHRTLPDGVCPLFFPILVNDKRRVAEGLWSRGIEAVEFWNYGDSVADGPRAAGARFLRKHVLELPIHQGLSESHITYLAEQVSCLDVGFDPAGEGGRVQAAFEPSGVETGASLAAGMDSRPRPA